MLETTFFVVKIPGEVTVHGTEPQPSRNPSEMELSQSLTSCSMILKSNVSQKLLKRKRTVEKNTTRNAKPSPDLHTCQTRPALRSFPSPSHSLSANTVALCQGILPAVHLDPENLC